MVGGENTDEGCGAGKLCKCLSQIKYCKILNHSDFKNNCF